MNVQITCIWIIITNDLKSVTTKDNLTLNLLTASNNNFSLTYSELTLYQSQCNCLKFNFSKTVVNIPNYNNILPHFRRFTIFTYFCFYKL